MSDRYNDDIRKARAVMRAEAATDVRRDGFISTGVSLQLETLGVDVAQLERDLLDRSDINHSE